jgi:hypothetical protein
VKYFLLLAIALLLSSCSTKPTVTIDFLNNSQSDWILVSVRDTSLVVLPTYEEIGKGIAFTHCIVIPLRSFHKITLHPPTGFLARIPLALFGAGLGFAISACNCNDRIYHTVVGFASGWILSGLQVFIESLKDHSYYLWLDADRDRLRTSAVYPVEPEIMKYVK